MTDAEAKELNIKPGDIVKFYDYDYLVRNYPGRNPLSPETEIYTEAGLPSDFLTECFYDSGKSIPMSVIDTSSSDGIIRFLQIEYFSGVQRATWWFDLKLFDPSFNVEKNNKFNELFAMILG